MSKTTPKHTPTEEFAGRFALPRLSRQLRHDTLTRARSAWAAQAETHGDSLMPYFLALAATLLMILTLNIIGQHMIQTGASGYMVTVRPGQGTLMSRDLPLNLPERRHIPLSIVGVSHVPYKTHFAQLQTVLSRGGAL